MLGALPRRRTLGSIVGIVLAGSCFAAPAAAAPRASSTIDWRACTEKEIPIPDETRARMQCATVEVPVDYSDPDGRTLELFVSRRAALAPDPLGPLFVNQGGPGKEAAVYAALVGAYDAFDRFDIIGMDPRGVGRSTWLDCTADIRKIPTFEFPTGGAKNDYERGVRKFVRSCTGDPNLPYFGTNNAARDMDRIRELLGSEQITYFGKSYGSDLGTAYTGLFPERVRAAVLDGATDLALDPVDFVAQQAQAGVRAFERYLEHCRVDSCAWTEGADPADAWARLLEQVDAKPVDAGERGDRLTGGQLRDFAHNASFGADTEEIDAALDALVVEGDPSELLSPPLSKDDIKDAIAFLAITCVDSPVSAFRPALARLRETVPDANPDTAAVLAFCSAWPKPGDPILVRNEPGRGPMVVVSTRGDVPTPYESGVSLASQLGAPLLTWEANAHTAYFFSPCIREAVDGLLVDLRAIPAGASCPDDKPSDPVFEPPAEPDLAAND